MLIYSFVVVVVNMSVIPYKSVDSLQARLYLGHFYIIRICESVQNNKCMSN